MTHHIAVLDPGTRVPELDCFNRMSLVSRLPLTYHLPAMHGLDSLERVADGLVAIIILGSGASVHDDLPWQHAMREWLRPRIERGLPSLGLCYGHQFLAHAMGGDVGFLFEDKAKLKGVRTITLDPDRLWGGSQQGKVVVSHRETVTELPEGCVNLGSTEHVAIEAFSHTELPVWGIQAHPEATMQFVTNNTVPFDDDPAILSFGHGLVDAFLDRVASDYSAG